MEKKKQNKIAGILLGVAIVVVAVITAIRMMNQVKPEVSINSTTLKIGMTVQELTDAGFTVGLSMTGSGGLDLNSYPQVPGEKYISDSYYIFKDGKYTNVSFSVFNKSVNACDFKDSRIYYFAYFNSKLNSSKTEVLVNGINISEMKKEGVIDAFEKLGVSFDSDDKNEFLSGEYGFIIGKSGNYSYEIEADDAKERIESIRAKQKV